MSKILYSTCEIPFDNMDNPDFDHDVMSVTVYEEECAVGGLRWYAFPTEDEKAIAAMEMTDNWIHGGAYSYD